VSWSIRSFNPEDNATLDYVECDDANEAAAEFERLCELARVRGGGYDLVNSETGKPYVFRFSVLLPGGLASW
jgi:hypothetical protein